MGKVSADIGKKGEDLALEFLKKKGYRILYRNWRMPRWGEVDIIAQDGKDLVFVEVKTRTDDYSGEPLEAVNYYKLRALKRAALFFKGSNPLTPESLRIDVISILLNESPRLDHLKSVYEDTLT